MSLSSLYPNRIFYLYKFANSGYIIKNKRFEYKQSYTNQLLVFDYGMVAQSRDNIAVINLSINSRIFFDAIFHPQGQVITLAPISQ